MKGMIFTYVLTYGGAAVSLFNPYVGLLIYISFAIIRPEAIWGWSFGGGGHNLSEIVAGALLVGWALNGFGTWRLGRGRAVLFAFIGFWIWAGLSTVVAASNQRVAQSFLIDTLKILLPFIVGMTLIDSPQRLKQLAWVLTLSCGYVALRENETYLKHGLPSLDNMLAESMAVGAGVAFFTGLNAKKWWNKLLAFACAALAVHTVLIHMCRGAMLGLCVLAVVTFIIVEKTPKMLSLYALATVVGLYMAGPPVVREFTSAFESKNNLDPSAVSRFELWSAMIKSTADHPLFGLGPYHWRVHSFEFGFNKGKDGHGLWFQIPAEHGVPGAAMFVGIFMIPIWRLFWLIRRNRPEHAPIIPFAQLSVAALSCFMVEEVFDSSFGMEVAFYTAMFGGATLRVASKLQHEAAWDAEQSGEDIFDPASTDGDDGDDQFHEDFDHDEDTGEDERLTEVVGPAIGHRTAAVPGIEHADWKTSSDSPDRNDREPLGTR